MVSEGTLLMMAAGLFVIFGLWVSRRAHQAAVEHAMVSGYFAGVIDTRLATSENHSLSDHPRPWADENWYLMHCAGTIEMYDADKAARAEYGDNPPDP